MGIPIPKTLVIWASPSHITLAIWVRVTGDAHITRVLRMGIPVSLWHRPSPFLSKKVWRRGWCAERKVGRGKRLHLSHFLSIVPCASSPVTRVSRSPLCEIWSAWRGGRPWIVMIKLSSRLQPAWLSCAGISFPSPFKRLPRTLSRLWKPTVRICFRSKLLFLTV